MADEKVYVQGEFRRSGQHSFIRAPAQAQDQYEALTNVRPPDTSVFRKRFGYTQWHNTGFVTRRLYEYQKDADSSRRIIATSTAFVQSMSEDGTDHNTSIFIPNVGATDQPRVVVSRDFAFFQDGNAADVLKWSGSGQNYLTRSEEFDHADWTKEGVGGGSAPTITPNATTDPLGGSTADQIDFPATGVGEFSRIIQDAFSVLPDVPSQTFTASVWLKAGSALDIKLSIPDSPTESSITANVTTSWQRFSVSHTADPAATLLRLDLTNIPSEAAKTLFAWGAQLQYGAAKGTYEVTTSSIVTGVDKWGITAPTTNLAVGAPTGGAVTLDIGRKYFVVFRNSITGHNSGLSPVSPTTGPIDAKDVPLTAIEVSSDPQADRKLVLATADGGDETKLFFLADIPSAQTTLTDNITEAVLIASNIYLELDSSGEERGLSDNDRPLTFTLIVKHRGRIWAAGNAANPQWVYFSKSIADLTTSSGTLTGRYEEAWPSGNFFDISSGAETVKALFTDGVTLYVATERHIRRILGDGQTLQNPEILFNNVGVVNQDVWKTVFMEGTPAGTMFLTPDLKVIFTDFNVYHNVGEPIQDILNNINVANIRKASAVFYSNGADDWYVLAIPTGAATEPNTLLVYDLGNRQWYVWKLSTSIRAQLLNVKANGSVQWLFGGIDSRIHHLQAASTQDKEGQDPDVPVSFTSTIQTTWRHLDTPQAVKILNKIKLFSSDAAIAVTIEGASTRAEFSSPVAIVTSSVPVSGPLGDLEVYLAGLVSKDRFYRYKFVSTADLAETFPMLSYWETYFVPYTVF